MVSVLVDFFDGEEAPLSALALAIVVGVLAFSALADDVFILSASLLPDLALAFEALAVLLPDLLLKVSVGDEVSGSGSINEYMKKDEV